MTTTGNKPYPQSRTANSPQVSAVASEKLQQASEHFVAAPARDIFSALRDYAHEKPDVAAMWCFGVGLVVGWKLRG